MIKTSFRKNPLYLYLVVSAAALTACFLYVMISGRGTDVFDWLVLGTSNDWELADFFRHIGYSSDLSQTYYVSNDACFPPLAYLFFHMLYRLNPLPAEISADNWQAYAMYPYEILLYLFVLATSVILLLEVLRGMLSGKSSKKGLAEAAGDMTVAEEAASWVIPVLTLLLLASAPLFIAIERGNPVFPVTVMTLWALYLQNEEEAWKKELALILIAVAAGFKIYPAIFGLLYIKEKRFPETLRLILYGVLLFFVPFAFVGGFAGFRQFLNVLSAGHYNADFMKEWSSVRGMCRSILPKIGFSDALAVTAGTVAENIFLLISVVLSFTAKEKWKSVLFLTAAMTYYMPTSWCYNMVYYLLPLAVYFESCSEGETASNPEKGAGINILYTLLFTAIFSVPVWGVYRSITRLICVPGYLLWGVAVITEIQSLIRRKKQRSAPVQNK